MEGIGMIRAEVADLVEKARNATSAERVELLACAAALARHPLERLELLMLVADAAGRAAHGEAGRAQRGDGMPERHGASWAEIGKAAGLERDAAWKQYHHGAALSWPTTARGVRRRQYEGQR